MNEYSFRLKSFLDNRVLTATIWAVERNEAIALAKLMYNIDGENAEFVSMPKLINKEL